MSENVILNTKIGRS